jgi:hypothetical protein
MFCGVLVLGGIAATYVAAAQAQAKMYPSIAHLQTLFAAFGLWLQALDLIEVRAVFSHGCLQRNYIVA